MKRFFFGVLLIAIGFPFSLFCFVQAAINPWTYNGISGLMGSFLGTDMLIPFLLSTILVVAGLVVCALEAYRRK